MKRSFLIFYALVNLSLVFGQNLTHEWAATFGSTSNDAAFDLAIDHQGDLIVVGGFQDTVDVTKNHRIIAKGRSDVFIMKMTASKEVKWVKSLGGTGSDEAYAVETDAMGNIYLTGIYRFTVDFDPGPSIHNVSDKAGYDAFILKLDKDGNFQWVETLRSGGFDSGNSIATDSEMNVYVTGRTDGNITGDPSKINEAPFSFAGIYLKKFNSNGDEQWLHKFHTGNNNLFTEGEITIDQYDNKYIIGSFYDSVFVNIHSFEKLLETGDNKGMFVLKMDARDSVVWLKSMSSSGWSKIRSIDVNAQGDIITAGTYEGKIDFDPGEANYMSTSNGYGDVFLHKMDKDGEFQWVKTFGGESHDEGRSVKFDKNNNIYLTGTFIEYVDMNPGEDESKWISSEGYYDAFLQKYDSVGNMIWLNTFGDQMRDFSYDVEIDENLDVYTVGKFEMDTKIISGEKELEIVTNGVHDAFVIKYNQCEVYEDTVEVHACRSYRWEDIWETYYESGVYTAKLENKNGCDSIIHLDLTIHQLDSSIIAEEGKLIAKTEGVSYEWMSCYWEDEEVTYSYDREFKPEEDGYYQLVINTDYCRDTTECYEVDALGIKSIASDLSRFVYPNPTKGILTLDVPWTHEIQQLFLLNMAGDRLEMIENTGSKQIDINQEPGMYILEIETGNKRYYTKILVE